MCKRCNRIGLACGEKFLPQEMPVSRRRAVLKDSVPTWDRNSSLFEYVCQITRLGHEDAWERLLEDARSFFRGTPPGTFPPASNEYSIPLQQTAYRGTPTFSQLDPNLIPPTLGNQAQSPQTLFTHRNGSQNHDYYDTPVPRHGGSEIANLTTVTYTARMPSPARVCKSWTFR